MTTSESLLALVRDHRLRLVALTWLDCRGDRLVPDRADLDPAALASVLPHMWVNEFDTATGRFRCRLAGATVNAMYGVHLRGRFLDEYLPPDLYARLAEPYRRALEVPGIVHVTARLKGETAEHDIVGERLVLPARGANGLTDLLVGATVYDVVMPAEDRVRASEDLVISFLPLTAP